MSLDTIPTQSSILYEVLLERRRQEDLIVQGRFSASLATPGALTPAECLTVIAAEFGEVAEIVADSLSGKKGPLDTAHLRDELIQVAACCVAWVEQLSGCPYVLPVAPEVRE